MSWEGRRGRAGVVRASGGASTNPPRFETDKGEEDERMRGRLM